MTKTIQERIDLIKSIGEEIIGGENLEKLLENKKNIIAYDGFEPSGRMHIAQGLLRAHNVNKFIDAGIKFKFWVADWFALMNLKLGGDINKIQKAGKLMIEVWKACGMKLDATDEDGNHMIEFIWSSDEINKRSDEYWKLVLDIGTSFGLNRIKKCTQIMGKKEEKENIENLIKIQTKLQELEDNINLLDQMENIKEIKQIINSMIDNTKEELAASQIFYPVMQCADVFFLKVDITSLGLDQKKCNMLALEYCDKIKRKNKPIIISHHMIMGLDGSDKMSKSNPDNTIFMDDTEEDVKRKITKAFCEPGNIDKNPILDWIKWLILPVGKSIIILGNPKFNELDKIYTNYEDIEDDFKNLKIYPTELKKALIVKINELLTPIRQYFINNHDAQLLSNQVKNYNKK